MISRVHRELEWKIALSTKGAVFHHWYTLSQPIKLSLNKWYFVLFFFYDTSEEKFLTSDLSFSQVTEVDKREPRESFSKPRPHFWGRGRRPRPRNEQAEAEKCSPRFPFVYWGNWGNLKSDVDKFLPKKVASTIIKTECFFHLSGFFVTLNRFSEWEKWKLD